MYTLDQIVIKGLEAEHRLLRIKILLSDRPGSLREVLEVIAGVKANVVKIEHDRVADEVPVGKALVTFDLETQNLEHTQSLLASLDRFKVIQKRRKAFR